MTFVEQSPRQSLVSSFRNIVFAASAALTLFGFSHQQAEAQNSWSVSYSSSTSVGGVSGRPTPAATVSNGSFLVTYTAPGGVTDQYGNHTVMFGTCSPTSCGTFSPIENNYAQASYSNANPSIAVVNGTIYVAYVAVTGAAQGSEPTNTMYITSSTTGGAYSWTNPVAVGTLYNTGVDYSPSMIAYNGNLYIGNHSVNGTSDPFHAIGLCVSATPTLNFSCSAVPNPSGGFVTAGYNPGLAVFNNTLYMGYVTDANSHDMYYITSPISSPFSFSGPNTSLSGSQSSCAPHLDVWNGNLNFDVRTNDGAQKFSQRHSSNGSSWSSWPDAHISIAGEPAIVSGAGLAGADANYNYMFYATDDSNNYLVITRGQ